MATAVSMETIVALCKRRGFIFQSSEIYGGFGSTFDYGPLGVELKRNVKDLWWRSMVYDRDDILGLDSAILMAPQVWVASGHLAEFSDPMVDCKQCQQRFRADHLEGDRCPSCGGELTEPRKFNMMFKTFVGPVEDDAAVAYLRPETAQGIFVNFRNVVQTSRRRLPFGIAQMGKSFRNEITPGNFIFRTREFEQMEMEYFVRPDDAMTWHQHWIQQRYDWYLRYGIRPERLRVRAHDASELSHYSKATSDVEYHFPFGWGELEGIAHRGDYDLTQHGRHSGEDLSYLDDERHERFVPNVIEPAAGVDRTALTFLIDAYDEEPDKDGTRVVLRFHPAVAPVKVAVLPLSKKENLSALAREVWGKLRGRYLTVYDETQSIGRRYRRQDEIGTPLCVTVDFDSLEDQSVTIRERDSMAQIRVPIAELRAVVDEKLAL